MADSTNKREIQGGAVVKVNTAMKSLGVRVEDPQIYLILHSRICSSVHTFAGPNLNMNKGSEDLPPHM